MKNFQKYLPQKVIFEASIIIICSTILGFVVNIFHPNKVKITTERPHLEFVPDTLLSQELPDVGITEDNQNDDSNNQTPDNTFVVKTKQLISLIENEKALIIDARFNLLYDQEHIPDAINLPVEEIFEHEDTIQSLPKNKWLVCYCDDPACDLAKLLALELMNYEYTKILYYQGGLQDWKENNFPTVKTDMNNER